MSTPTGILFFDPQSKPLSTTGQPQAGAYYLFYLTGTLTAANVYADGALSTPLSQTPGTTQPSCTADSAGRFNPIYMSPSVVYRVQLYSSVGVKLEDTDPYVVPGSPSATFIGAALYPPVTAEGATVVNGQYNYGVVDRYGTNTTPGTTDITTAVNNALASGFNVTFLPGETYYVGPLTASTANQYIVAYGATILQKAASNSPILTLTGNGAKVRGGIWDGNYTNQSGGASVQFSHAGVCINANDCSVKDGTMQNSYGLGISGHLCNRATIQNNKITLPANGVSSEVIAIYLESLTANVVGNNVLDNNIDCTANAFANGVLLAGPTTHAFTQTGYMISRNTLNGNTTGSSVGITTQTIGAGKTFDNDVTGFSIAISGDAANGSLISANRLQGMGTVIGYGIEINGSGNTISDNVINGGNYALIASAANSNLTSNNWKNNTSTGAQIAGLYIQASPLAITFTGTLSLGATSATLSAVPTIVTGPYYVVFSTGEIRAVNFTNQSTAVTFSALSSAETATASINFNAQYQSIEGNTLDLSLAASQRVGIVFAGDCQFSNVSGGNTIRGPGSAQTSSVGVSLQIEGAPGIAGAQGTSGGNISITGNKFSGWGFATQVYAPGSFTYAGVVVDNNDCLNDVTAVTGTTGSATWGNYCTAINNRSPQMRLDILDQGTNLIEMYSASFSSPNSHISAGIGSKYTNINGTAGATWWVKVTGANTNSGWVANATQ
jgi:hypothetical protein